MKLKTTFLKATLMLGLFITVCDLFPNQAKAQEVNLSHLGAYGKTSTFCGEQPIKQNDPTIPWIGCFILTPGKKATGTFQSHKVETSVDSQGNEIFIVDGSLVKEDRHTATWTNLPYVSEGGEAGYSFSTEATDRNSYHPSRITIFSRNPDKSILFMVSECLPPAYNVCVSTQENWDYEKSRGH